MNSGSRSQMLSSGKCWRHCKVYSPQSSSAFEHVPPFLFDIREIKIHVYTNLYHMTKFSLFYYFYSKISIITPVLFIRIVLDSFYLLTFYSEKFST